jgi:Amt family ammonium transporter
MGGLGMQTSIGAQLVTQATGVIATIVWCGVVTFILLKVLDAVIGLRVSIEEETEGLDLVLHDERGYNF